MWNKRTAHPTPRQHSRGRTTKREESSSAPLGALLKSVAASLISALLSLFLLSTVAYFSKDPTALLLPLGLVAAAISALIGGFTAVRIHRKSALLCGLCNGCTVMAIMLVLSLFFRSATSAHTPLVSCLLHAGYLLLSVLGAFAALPRTSRVDTARRPRRR